MFPSKTHPPPARLTCDANCSHVVRKVCHAQRHHILNSCVLGSLQVAGADCVVEGARPEPLGKEEGVGGEAADEPLLDAIACTWRALLSCNIIR